MSCQVCINDFGKFGTCEDGACVCAAGYKGPGCAEPDCGPENCSGKGQCTFTSSNAPPECACEFGFTGA